LRIGEKEGGHLTEPEEGGGELRARGGGEEGGEGGSRGGGGGRGGGVGNHYRSSPSENR